MNVILDVSEFQSLGQLDHLLRNADDEVIAVYIKATQGLAYSDSMADAFAAVCLAHNTPFGYYDFMTNDQASSQAMSFKDFIASLRHKPSRRPMTDAEGAYNKYAAGITNWENAFGTVPLIYAPLSMMPKYASMPNRKWVAQYDSMSYYRPAQSEINAYASQGYAAWQFTSNYCGLNQDASILLGDMGALMMPSPLALKDDD